MSAYREFAQIYDTLMDDIPYDRWAQRVEELLDFHIGMRVTELGCGTGAFSVRLARDGAVLTATDLSPAMLERAQARARREGVKVLFAQADMEHLALPGKAEGIFCACDGINYLTSLPRVRRCFSRVYSALAPGGRFVFDISGRDKLERMAGEMYGEDREDITYLWNNEWAGDERDRVLRMSLVFFVREADGRYRRFEEEHLQRAHGREEILQALSDSGFAEIHAWDGLENRAAQGEEERLLFSARRPE